MDVTNLVSFVLASMVLTIAPGPDLVFVITQSVAQGKKAGIAIAMGLCTGLVFHTTAAALGISVILHQSAIAFNIVKYAGVAYLFYLAFKSFKEKEGIGMDDLSNVKKADLLQLYKRGIFMNILNPKVALFFLAFLPQFVDETRGGVAIQMISLGLVFMMQAIVIFTIVSYLTGFFRDKLFNNKKVGRGISLGKGIVYTLIGLKIALTK